MYLEDPNVEGEAGRFFELLEGIYVKVPEDADDRILEYMKERKMVKYETAVILYQDFVN